MELFAPELLDRNRNTVIKKRKEKGAVNAKKKKCNTLTKEGKRLREGSRRSSLGDSQASSTRRGLRSSVH